jgi:LemA protein
MGVGAWIFLAILIAFVLWAIAIYNGLVALRNRFNNAYAQVDVQLKRRYDLVAGLVESVKGQLQQGHETLDAVAQARANALNAAQRAAAAPGDPAAMQGLAQAEGALGGALGQLLALFESHPDLKANHKLLALQEELVGSESKVAFARQAYNDSVMQYNTKRDSFPDNLFAGALGFGAAELLAA